MTDEPGRYVTESGLIKYCWPPEGRFVELWARIEAAIKPEERSDAISLLHLWREETSTLVAYTDENGEWVDCEPDWSVPEAWKNDPT